MNKNSQNKLKKQSTQKDNDSSDVSSYDEDYDNMTSDEISQKGKDKF